MDGNVLNIEYDLFALSSTLSTVELYLLEKLQFCSLKILAPREDLKEL